MLTILNDPAGITGRARHEWDCSVSMQENIQRHLSFGGECAVRINGREVDPCTEQRLDAPPRPDDVVTITRRPAGFDPVTWLYIAYAVLFVAVLTMLPKAPNVGDAGKDSPNNSLTGQTNIARTYQAIPDVYGYRRVWPDLIQPSTVEYVDNIKYVTEWMCISRGKGTVSDVQYAETPIGDIDGASYEVFEPVPVDGYPEYGSTTLLDVIETFESPEVNGQEIAPALPYVDLVFGAATLNATAAATSFTLIVPDSPDLAQLKSLAPAGAAQVGFTYGISGSTFAQTCTVLGFVVAGGNCTFTFGSAAWATSESGAATAVHITPNGSTTTTIGPFTMPLDCDRLRWNTVFLRGLKGTVTIRAEWWQVDGAGVEIGGTRQHQDDTYTASTFDQRFYTVNATPSAGHGRYRVQFTRLTVQIGDGSADVAKLEEVYAVRYYATKVLPGVTCFRVTTKATEQATGFSDRKFNLRWLRHVRTLADDTLGESRNFARAMAHIWTIAGQAMADLDVDTMAGINAEFGEDSPLLRFDCSLDDADMSLGERMQLVANHARCVVWRDGLQWTMTRDQARDVPELQLDYRNLAAGGDSAISYAAFLPATNDGVEIEYVDEESQSKKAYVRYDISSGVLVAQLSANPKKIQLLGCTTLAQADNRARLEARRLLYQRTSVNDTALNDAGSLGIGSLVKWIDPNDFAGDDDLQAGEVMAISGPLILTSEPIDWKGESVGRVLFTGADGRHLGPPVQCYPNGAGMTLADLPQYGLYVADQDRQCGSRYVFAVGLTDAELEAAGLYTVTSSKPIGNGTFSLILSNYDARMYEDD